MDIKHTAGALKDLFAREKAKFEVNVALPIALIVIDIYAKQLLLALASGRLDLRLTWYLRVILVLECKNLEQFLLFCLTYSLASVHYVHLEHLLVVIEARLDRYLAIVCLL